jgi:hypothetical protein
VSADGAGLEAFLRAIALLTRSVDELKGSVDRLVGEFERVSAQAPPPAPPSTPVDRIAGVAGDALSEALREAFGGKKKRK